MIYLVWISLFYSSSALTNCERKTSDNAGKLDDATKTREHLSYYRTGLFFDYAKNGGRSVYGHLRLKLDSSCYKNKDKLWDLNIEVDFSSKFKLSVNNATEIAVLSTKGDEAIISDDGTKIVFNFREISYNKETPYG